MYGIVVKVSVFPVALCLADTFPEECLVLEHIAHEHRVEMVVADAFPIVFPYRGDGLAYGILHKQAELPAVNLDRGVDIARIA